MIIFENTGITVATKNRKGGLWELTFMASKGVKEMACPSCKAVVRLLVPASIADELEMGDVLTNVISKVDT